MREPQLLERALVGAALGDLDLAPRGLGDRSWSRRATPVHEVLPHLLIAGAEAGVCGQLDASRQSRRGEVCATLRHIADCGFPGAYGIQSQRDAEVLGEAAGEL